jgi:hypothetical protein
MNNFHILDFNGFSHFLEITLKQIECSDKYPSLSSARWEISSHLQYASNKNMMNVQSCSRGLKTTHDPLL